MKYDVWVHHNGRSAKNAGMVAAKPLKQYTGYEGTTVLYRILDESHQDHFTFEVLGSNWTVDDLAWRELDRLYRTKHPSEKRPLAGRSYLRECRPSFREAAKTTEGR